MNAYDLIKILDTSVLSEEQVDDLVETLNNLNRELEQKEWASRVTIEQLNKVFGEL